jgi:hypothetical protein
MQGYKLRSHIYRCDPLVGHRTRYTTILPVLVFKLISRGPRPPGRDRPCCAITCWHLVSNTRIDGVTELLTKMSLANHPGTVQDSKAKRQEHLKSCFRDLGR